MVLQPRGLHYSSTSGNLSGTHGISSVANSQALTSRKGSNVCSRMRSEIRNPYNGHFRGFLPLNNIVARTRFLDEQKCHPGQRLEGCSPAARCRCHAGLPVHGPLQIFLALFALEMQLTSRPIETLTPPDSAVLIA